MKNTFFIVLLFILSSCHKSAQPIQPSPPVTNHKMPIDTETLFFKGNNWIKQKVWNTNPKIAYFIAFDSLNLRDTFYSPPFADFQDLIELDSCILFVFNKGWQKLYPYGNNLAKYGGNGIPYIIYYPNDTLVYDAWGSGETPVSGEENGRCYVSLMYQTLYFNNKIPNDTLPNDTNIYFKVFVKPINSNIHP